MTRIEDHEASFTRAVEKALAHTHFVERLLNREIIDLAENLVCDAKDQERYDTAKEVVYEQANDVGLWAVAETAMEAYLQQALRRLHAVLEGQ